MNKTQSTKYQINVLHFLDDNYIYKESEKTRPVFFIKYYYFMGVSDCETKYMNANCKASEVVAPHNIPEFTL